MSNSALTSWYEQIRYVNTITDICLNSSTFKTLQSQQCSL
uniref:Uncharacterized protein n=1 Tax=Rhizophora mucronata TaxID=61149 RepID=A0A2P2PDK8_RHIMU